MTSGQRDVPARRTAVEPGVGAMLVGFVEGDVAGAWHRGEPDEWGRGWYSTYAGSPNRPFTWAEAVARGAHAAHDLHTAPTQWAYDAACAALEKHRQRASDAERELANARSALADVRALVQDSAHTAVYDLRADIVTALGPWAFTAGQEHLAGAVEPAPGPDDTAELRRRADQLRKDQP